MFQNRITKQELPIILLVDDSLQNLDIISEILKKEYSIKVANSAQKALSYLQNSKKPDLVLLDILMPEIDGYMFCEMLKKDSKFADIPVIFLTALEQDDDIIRGLELGAVDYVVKPVSPPVLKARVGAHVKLKKFQDSLKEAIDEKDNLLLQQSKMAILGEMLENIVHQWKQPISMISMSSANIRVDMMFGNLQDDALEKALEGIESSVEHLSQIMDDFRDFLHEESQVQSQNLKTIVEKSIELMGSKMRISSIELQTNIPDYEMKLFKNDLIQIFMNILSNSIDVLEKKEGEKRINISFKEEDANIKLLICDNGGGIKEEFMDKIFDKYFTTKEDKKGSGIGLYMCRILAQKRLKGSIRAFNSDSGACFEITLPKEKV